MANASAASIGVALGPGAVRAMLVDMRGRVRGQWHGGGAEDGTDDRAWQGEALGAAVRAMQVQAASQAVRIIGIGVAVEGASELAAGTPGIGMAVTWAGCADVAAVPAAGVVEPNTLISPRKLPQCTRGWGCVRGHLLNSRQDRIVANITRAVPGGILPGYNGYIITDEHLSRVECALGAAELTDAQREACALRYAVERIREAGVQCRRFVVACDEAYAAGNALDPTAAGRFATWANVLRRRIAVRTLDAGPMRGAAIQAALRASPSAHSHASASMLIKAMARYRERVIRPDLGQAREWEERYQGLVARMDAASG